MRTVADVYEEIGEVLPLVVGDGASASGVDPHPLGNGDGTTIDHGAATAAIVLGIGGGGTKGSSKLLKGEFRRFEGSFHPSLVGRKGFAREVDSWQRQGVRLDGKLDGSFEVKVGYGSPSVVGHGPVMALHVGVFGEAKAQGASEFVLEKCEKPSWGLELEVLPKPRQTSCRVTGLKVGRGFVL